MGILDTFRARSGGETSTAIQQFVALPATQPGLPHFAVIDVETTGLDPEQHRILEVAIVTTDPWGRVQEEWSTRLNPQGPVGATHIHGITDADVADSPVFAEVIAQLNQRLAGAAVAAHHANFDLAFLRAEYRRAGWELPDLLALCTLEASAYHLPMLERRRLADCCWAVGTPLIGAHSALGDARATAVLLAAFMHPHVGHPPLPQHVAMTNDALTIPWPPGPARTPQQTQSAGTAGHSPPLTERHPVALAAHPSEAAMPALVALVERFSLIDALDEGAPAGAVAYLEKLAEVLEDGEVTAEEAEHLAAVADTEQLTNEDIAAANQAFVLALAYAAMEDGKVTRLERSELQSVSDILGVSQKVIPALLDRAEQARNQRMSSSLRDLPPDWGHGEPLRVGDKVAFTGCGGSNRIRMESESERLGVRVVGGVSAKTSMLVADGSVDGTKAVKARELHTRVVQPDAYVFLLQYLQPALERDMRALPKTRPAHVPRHAEGVLVNDPATTQATRIAGGDNMPDPGEVRAWARANGYEVGVRGRLSKDLLDAFAAAQD